MIGAKRTRKFWLKMPPTSLEMALPRPSEDSESLKKDFERFLEDTNQRTSLNDVTDRCSSIRRRCVESGQLFKRNVVCASNMKRYMNLCHLQIRSCDLLEQSGDELQQKRCLWIEVPDDGDNGDDSSGTNSKGTSSTSTDEDSDVTGSNSKSKSDGSNSKMRTNDEDSIDGESEDGDSGDDSSGTNSKGTNSKSKDEDSDVTGSNSKSKSDSSGSKMRTNDEDSIDGESEDGDNGDDSSGRNSKGTNSKSKDEDSDVTGSNSKSKSDSSGSKMRTSDEDQGVTSGNEYVTKIDGKSEGGDKFQQVKITLYTAHDVGLTLNKQVKARENFQQME
ncbi:hypothetical protein BSL78_07460 [Apostichopus japonicus]|uniref:Uncharacterized protein n=1 Tax=Stichopus japonicus TaxID=307972 RepID=A0A2G8L5T8_STIJA|nr:hypothetical protein BSL78_07460 [Apostichopus japonicus]